jgi:hypothetical protein
LGSHTKIKTIQKKIYWSEKRMLECRKRPILVEDVQKCKMLKFDSIFLTGESLVNKEN